MTPAVYHLPSPNLDILPDTSLHVHVTSGQESQVRNVIAEYRASFFYITTMMRLLAVCLGMCRVWAETQFLKKINRHLISN